MKQQQENTPSSRETPPSEKDDVQLRATMNRRISRLCALAAIVICAVAFATIIIGAENVRFVLLGVVASVILLAVAFLQEHDIKR